MEWRVRIAAPPETIFPFFIDPQKMARWLGFRATLNPQPGGICRIEINERDIIRGDYLEVVPSSRVVFTWGWEGEGSPLPAGSTTVEITLVPDGDGTIVHLRHMDIPAAQKLMQDTGWQHYLPRLIIAAEGGEPEPDPWATSPMV
jgi:uncharacterized protein YndB with AHSA1/START domain